MKSILTFIFFISFGSCTRMTENECIQYYDMIKINKQPTTADVNNIKTFNDALEDAFTNADLYDDLIADYLL